MMRNKQSIFIILIAFASGFAVNEYRHKKLNPTQSLTYESFVDYPEPPVEVAVSSAPQKIEKTSVDPADGAELEAFSWAKVDQLIAVARYEDAITLLQTQMGNAKNVAHAWLTLAYIYRKQSLPIAAIDAWFRYVRLEMDDQKINKALNDIKDYLLVLKKTPALFHDDHSWLMAQFDELLKYNPGDSELHLILAALLLDINDSYQAQYHALMAANDPRSQKKAEIILAQLNGSNTPQELSVPLIRYGNQYLVNVTIEGYAARLLVDTGASLSGLSSSYTAKYPSLIKASKPIRLNTASGAQDSILFTVNNITLESLVFNQHILAQLPMDNAEGFDGLLGVDILGRFDFVIDQNAAVLRLSLRK